MGRIGITSRWNILITCMCFFVSVCDFIAQDSANGAGGPDPGHSPEHVWHGGAGGADPAAQHGQQPGYSFKIRTGAHMQRTGGEYQTLLQPVW